MRLKAALLLTALVAATAASSARANNPAGQDLTGTLKKVKDTGALTIGYRDASVPFSYLDGSQKPVGYAYEICLKVADAVKAHLKLDKLDVRLNPVTSATRIPLIANGTIDLECGSTTNNADRQRQAAFTNTHFLTATRFVAKKEKGLDKTDDLKGRTVVSTSGTTNIRQINEINAARGLGMRILPAKDHAEGFLMMETGRADAFVMDDVLLAALVAGSKTPEAYTISSEAQSRPEPYGIMLRKDDAPFKAVVDAATAALYKSPEGKALYDKWFTQPIPPRGINLKLPMSEAMQKVFASPSDSADPAAY
ncbi:amino acid ABC transporter substrate-binding protein [Methylorubrum podarium]|jgi:glutamate/aspartate transport system substrate-binding protein|uniref:Amino acid ABC transporter substrate-binding protein n=1 Tax=Methylorubrum podarium TaxID=200476 RepID=A0ABV1QTT2_9HYPH|nr:amino acid ABC transporter substrate-binding protein [Methylorubrum podarium]MDV2982724.1 amino acid ABC transporter substrate-binding protein [Methylobacteriaceae bacterium AG10]GJE70142.1 Glutamate/aspartate import solute-binding protein [Methylorubrum podarium]